MLCLILCLQSIVLVIAILTFLREFPVCLWFIVLNNFISQENESKSGSESEEDIAASLEKEIKELKDQSKNKTKQRFQQVDSGANNCLFIKTTLPDPNLIAATIYKDIAESNKAQSRFIMRFLPVLNTCKANADSIETLAEKLLRPYFCDKSDGTSYAVIFKSRNNNSVIKKTIQEAIWQVVISLSIKNRVDLVDPEYIVYIGVIKNVCTISVLKDYAKYKKYNLQEITNPTPVPQPNKSTGNEEPDTKDKSEEEKKEENKHDEEISEPIKVDKSEDKMSEKLEESTDGGLVDKVKVSKELQESVQ